MSGDEIVALAAGMFILGFGLGIVYALRLVYQGVRKHRSFDGESMVFTVDRVLWDATRRDPDPVGRHRAAIALHEFREGIKP